MTGTSAKRWAILCPACGGLWFTTDWNLRGRSLPCPDGRHQVAASGAADGQTT